MFLRPVSVAVASLPAAYVATPPAGAAKKAVGPDESAGSGRRDMPRAIPARGVAPSDRLPPEFASIVTDTLASIGLPALVVDRGCSVVAVNSLIGMLSEHIRWRSPQYFSLRNSHTDARFRKAIATIAVDPAAPACSFAMRASASITMVGHVMSVGRFVRDNIDGCCAIFMATPLTISELPATQLVQSLFDLTPAEARVARRLMACETIEEIAASRNVSPHTVRTHLRSIFAKTGCRRQVDLVALLNRMSIPSVRPADDRPHR